MLMLARAFYSLEVHKLCAVWIERVASDSNLPDWPSRGKGPEAARAIDGKFLGNLELDQSTLNLIFANDLPRGLFHAES